MLGWLLGAAVTYSALKGASTYAGQKSQRAYPNLNRSKFDEDNMIHGIGEFNETKINQIAARCGVRPNKDGILPLLGHKNCLKYVQEYNGNVDDFIESWILLVKCQEDRSKGRIHDKYNERYHKLANAYANKETHNFSDTETYTFQVQHWYDLPLYEHKARCKEICDETFLGDYAINYPNVHASKQVYGARTEVWTVKKRIYDRPISDRLVKRTWVGAYYTCCKYLGYKP